MYALPTFLLPELTKWPAPIPIPSPSPPAAMTSSLGLASLIPVAKGSDLPWRVCTPYVLMKWGTFPEQPIPETITVLLGSMLISASAIWTALRMPKSPHPGHQSLCASVLSSESLSAMSQHHSCGSLSFRDKLDSVVDLLRGHWATVVLHDILLYGDASLLPDQPPELPRVVHLDVNDLCRLRENLLDVLRGEGVDQSYLKEVRDDSVLLEPLHRVKNRALR